MGYIHTYTSGAKLNEWPVCTVKEREKKKMESYTISISFSVNVRWDTYIHIGGKTKWMTRMHSERTKRTREIKKENYTISCHGHENVLIGISERFTWFKASNFSISRAIWISLGLKRSVKALIKKCGTIAATTMISSSNQNKPVPIIWKMALKSLFDVSLLHL